MSPTSKGKKGGAAAGGGGQRRPPATNTFPPLAWEREQNVISKTMPPTDGGARSVAPGKRRASAVMAAPLDEASARTVLKERFVAAGYQVKPDVQFRAAGVVATLDGYDAGHKVGFSYVSSHGADVVTDIGPEEEETLVQLHTTGRVHVLVVHDKDAPDAAELARLADAFLGTIKRK